MLGDMKHMRCEWLTDESYRKLRGKKVLIAGGTGFIGNRAVEILGKLGLDVYIISRRHYENQNNINYIKADLNDRDSLMNKLEGIHFDYCVYMAANIPLRGSKKEDYYDAKISTFDPFINFCEAFLNKCSQFTYISSIDVLGGCGTINYCEDAPIRVATPYGLAKYIGEFYTKNICGVNNIPYSILRFSQVYGPNEPIVRIIPIIKKAMLEGSKFTLVTNGEEKRRFLFIDDAVKAIVNSLLFSKNEIYNIAGPDEISMRDLILLIEKIWNQKINFEIKDEVKGEDNVPSISKAEQSIKYVPDVDIEEGLRIIMEVEKC